jgi:LmbE family N-acetylglucosaminyl deacetylase
MPPVRPYLPADGEALVFSPHLDDAVLSASLRLARPTARLATVFSAAPPDHLGETEWAVLTGASAVGPRHLERLAEDAAAAEVLGCAVAYLDQPEAEYRDNVPADLEAAAEAVARLLPGAAEIWAPAAIGGHPDHRAAREAVLLAVGRLADPPPVYLYADLPYSVHYGWPSWVARSHGRHWLDPDRWLNRDLRKRGLDPDRLEPLVFELTPEQREHKAAAIDCYRTQLPALGVAEGYGPRRADTLSHEVAWRTAA